MSTLERAIAIATKAHTGQIDKAGQAYISHPRRVIASLTTTDENIVGVLRDVVEDCPGWTSDRLRDEGFSEVVLSALDSVTKREGESYDDFVRRAASNVIGREVKRADPNDNLDLTRISMPTERDHARLETYRR
jgi:(p)ppGpp synthase/HD superfamily hydrolase